MTASIGVCATTTVVNRRAPKTTRITMHLLLLLIAAAAVVDDVNARPAHNDFDKTATSDTTTGDSGGDSKIADELLLASTKLEINKVLNNPAAAWRSRLASVGTILDAVPPRVFAQIALPPRFQQLPTSVLAAVRRVYDNAALTFRSKRMQIRRLLDMLTNAERATFDEELMPTGAPIGYQDALTPETYARLVAVYANTELNTMEKKVALDRLMRELPQETLKRLPLPTAMLALPEQLQPRLHALVYDYSRSWDERQRVLRKYVRSLPKKYRRLIRAQHVPDVFTNMMWAHVDRTTTISPLDELIASAQSSATTTQQPAIVKTATSTVATAAVMTTSNVPTTTTSRSIIHKHSN